MRSCTFVDLTTEGEAAGSIVTLLLTDCGLFDTCRHWVEQIAEAGMVGVIMCQSPEYVAPHGSTEAIFGTNPIAVGCPSDEGPFLIDLATSAQAW